jgi:DNA-binding MarR family transcriptional regulator
MPSKLQHELKKRGPFVTLAQEVLLSIARTSDQLLIRAERLMRKHGLTGSQYNVLRILRGEGKPLPILEIASRMVQVVPGITGLIDRLEGAGLVRRDRCTEDRRVIFVSITDKALAVLASLDEPLKSLEENLFRCLSVDEQQELIRVLEKVREHLDQIGD